MLKEGEIVKLDKNRYMSKKEVASIKSDLVLLLGRSPGLYITEIADSLNMSRKSISPVLDYLDEAGFTVRGYHRLLADLSMTSKTGSRLKSNSYSSLVTHAILIILLTLPLNACNPAKTSEQRPAFKHLNDALSRCCDTFYHCSDIFSSERRISFSRARLLHSSLLRLYHDFGKIMAGEKAHTDFTFRNTGKADLIIEKSQSRMWLHCSPGIFPARISPDGTGQIDVVFNTAGRKGKQSKNVSVMTNDPVNPVIQLTFSADIYVLVGFEPQRISFGKFSWKHMEQKTLKIVGESEFR